MLTSPEFNVGESPQPIIDFALVRNELEPILAENEYPFVNQLLTAASPEVESQIISLNECSQIAQTQLERIGVMAGVEFNNDYCDKINKDFPKECDPGKKIESPRKYTQKHGLDGGKRKNLKEYFAKESKNSRSLLVEKIALDQGNMQFIRPVSNDVLQDTVCSIVSETNEGISEYVEKIKELAPRPKEPRIGSIALLRKFTRTKETKPNHTVVTAIKELTSILESAKLGNEAFASIAANRHVDEYREGVRGQLETRYDRFTSEAILDLQGKLVIGYDAIRTNRSQTRITKTEDLITPENIIAPLKRNAQVEPELEQSAEIKEIPIGSIKNPFPWIKDGDIKFSIVTMGDETVVFCKAFTSLKSREISKKLRSQSRVASRFSTIIERIKRVEINKSAINHPLVKNVKCTDFHDLTVRYFSNYSAHAARVYYAVTSMGHYKGTGKLAEKHGVGKEAPLVILLAETDKSHQPRIYADIKGVDRYKKSRL